MSRFVTIMAVAGLVLIVSVQQAAAQGTSANRPNFVPYYRPELTPFLNLGRGGNPGINYYLGTLPEEQRRTNFDYLNSQVQTLDQKTLAAAREEQILNPVAQSTKTIYGNLGPYYGNTGAYYGPNGPRFGVVTPPRIGQPVGQQR